mmetsp:Transcript_8761/g.11031  ORF Transcript_8761/g.11031 Transcript_8761/m.11031 type:complete len:618 (+) Transcript_8761:222-2075(+)
MKWLSIGITSLTFTSLLSLFQCPHSKVEESFNLQATHDLYYHGISPAVESSISLFKKRSSKIDLPVRVSLGVQKQKNINDEEVNEEEKSFENQNNLDCYDHLRYPGVVPRTFLGPIILSSTMKLITSFLSPIMNLRQHPMMVQTLSRGLLLFFNIHAHYRLAKAANQSFEPSSNNFILGGYFLLITASQFHLPYYMSRMLPNIFALILVTHAYAEWFNSKYHHSLALLVFTAAIFRCDIIILLFTIGLTMLLQRRISIKQALYIGITTGLISLILTVPIDSVLWQRIVWPEGEVLFFNAIDNKSSEYGTSPYHWYFLNALPKGMLLTILLLPLSFIRLSQRILAFGNYSKTTILDIDRMGMTYIFPIVGFICLYSILPHKEIRFIFVAFPMLNVFAARGITSIHKVAFMVMMKNDNKEPGKIKTTADTKNTTKHNNLSKENDSTNTNTNNITTKLRNRMKIAKVCIVLLFLGGLSILLFTFIGNLIFISVSNRNYPGGDALNALTKEIEKKHEGSGSSRDVQIYVDVASAMTGVSLFGQHELKQKCNWCNVYKGGYENENKFENNDGNELIFDYILSEKSDLHGYNILQVTQGYPRFDLRKLSIFTKNAIYVLQRNN